MKKIFKPFVALIFLVQICLSQPVKAQLSDAERQERCQNNRDRVAEFEAQIRVIDADLSASMGERELEDTRTQLVYVKSLRLEKVKMDWSKFDRIAAIHKLNFRECFDEAEVSNKTPTNICVAKLEKIIAAKIDKSLSFDRPALQAKKRKLICK